MKSYYVLMLMAVVISADAMEMPPVSKKRPSEEEQPASAQKVKREAEQAAIIREPAVQMEAQRELSPEVQKAVAYLRAIAQQGAFPNEIAAQILQNLAKVKVTGATEAQKLYNAIANIRNFMAAFPQFYGDVGINGYLIQELAKRYMPDAPMNVAIALATTGAGQWLATFVGTDANRKGGMVNHLIHAAHIGELGKIRFILSYFPDLVNEIDIHQATALRTAALQGHQAIVKQLLQMPGININAHNQGVRALMIAAQNGRIGIVERLLQVPVINVNAQNQNGDTALILAAENGHTAIVERLLQVPGIDVTHNQGNLALIRAAEKGHAAVVEPLLQVPGIDVNAQDQRHHTALMFAAYNGHEAVVKRLLQVPGINVNAHNPSRFTALILATTMGKKAVVERLLQAPGIDVNIRTTNGYTALGLARQSNNPNKDAIIKRLIDFGGID